ncbi:hypothetical protein [Kitasatospora sp. NPDC001547]|uniref:hypothetical protein n=1 Tax=Kitasatospora sp. NPDC001547 TaxID=3364015 RepID=UPI0036C5A0DD
MYLSHQYVAALTGASTSQVQRFAAQHRLAPLVERAPGPCPLPTPARATLDGRPWREHIDFHEVPHLMRHLGTAAAVICLYLTGMRPQEVQNLRSGCCPDPQPTADGIPERHLILQPPLQERHR